MKICIAVCEKLLRMPWFKIARMSKCKNARVRGLITYATKEIQKGHKCAFA
jgi:hypothetical protein